MSDSFRAYRIHDRDGDISAGFETLTLADLHEGEVVIGAEYSSVNFKDALAATGKGKILRTSPCNGGIDVAGTVESSQDDRFSPGQKVLVTGCGLGEAHDGGYAEKVRVPADWIVPVPEGMNARQAMAIGTAGFTAALAIHRMEHNGQAPDQGKVLVTGATGGVGSFAINMLAGLGYEVSALTGKASEADYLKELGASEVLLRDETDFGKRPMEKSQWAGAVDNVGGEALTWLTRTVSWWGNIASIGNAASPKLETTVFPFILRGINLLGINSMATPMPLRHQVWDRIGSDLKPSKLDLITSQEVAFDELPPVFEQMIEGKIRGRTVVRIA
ncbi:NADPH2:quinone reductase [Natronospira proteinivora]|uniref:NADPH2:quinone reductase n=1 Tax=Natronospira proteinivora TaxID=1807133 RepID=A0ABT1GCX9_9GAMM|nr:oxidoreductase [Natronospira proteinivora]MCP1728223.1 NADPH2:quinone reductase [Natronospira proteinivora]